MSKVSDKATILLLHDKGMKLFLATFRQQHGEVEYDQQSFVRARFHDSAGRKCEGEMRHWWEGGMKKIGPDEYEEKGYLGRIVKLVSLIEITTLAEAISRVGLIE